MKGKVKDLIKEIYLSANGFGLFRWIPDKVLIPVLYRAATGTRLNLKNPVTFNEKIQWMKLYDHNPLYQIVVDKYAVRRYVADTLEGGEAYLVPLLGKWDSPGDIEWDSLPEQFVLKCNHDSGSVVICTDKNSFDRKRAEKKLWSHFRQNYYYVSREWAYKEVKRCVICEKYLVDDEVRELRDYKFLCFGGAVKMIQVDFGRHTVHTENLYTPDWELLDFTIKYPNNPAVIRKPDNLDNMLTVATELSQGFPQVRVDLYSVNGKIYFGEMTLYFGGGISKFSQEKYAVQMGNWIDLEQISRSDDSIHMKR